MALDTNRCLASARTGKPDVPLPSQHCRSRGRLTPEHRLRIAVLDEAIQCVEKYRLATDSRGRRLFDEAKQWLLAGETHWPYSFKRICAVLDLDVTVVRQHLRLAAEQAPASVSREMQVTTGERGTAVSVTSDTSVGSAPGIRSPSPPRRSSRTHNPTRSDVGIPHVATQTQ
jgi:hypothetical protein